jgi:GNAT superfamily N-acetyltransferase
VSPRVLAVEGGYTYTRESSAERGREFWADTGPFFASRDVATELGGPWFDSADTIWVVVRSEGRVVGLGSFHAGRVATAGVVTLDFMYVVPAHRRRGIYARMFDLRLALALELRPREVRGATRTDFIRTVFLRHGFAPSQERGSWTYYRKEIADRA